MGAGSARLLDLVSAITQMVDALDQTEAENRILVAEQQRLEDLVTELEQECDRLTDELRAIERREP